ncbi:MAG: HAD-IIA family hydrolase [Candidatus Aminicenantaceae bacterium]
MPPIGGLFMIDAVLKNKKVAFLDLDGTVYMGDRLFEGVSDFLGMLSRKNIPYYFLSNNSSRSKKDYVKKLTGMGIPAREENILLSTDGVLVFLKNKDVDNIFLLGTASMREMFQDAGIAAESEKPEYIVLGFDTELVYDKLKKAALWIQKGIPLLVSHPDLVCPTPEGPIPDAGSMLALLETATGKKAEKIFGKPNPEMITHILKKHRSSPRDAVMFGDRIYTDMELARRTGCDSVLLLSGETQPEDLGKLEYKPTLIAESLGSLLG